MTPIINPLWFYLIGMSSKVIPAFGWIGGILAFCWLIYTMICFFAWGEGWDVTKEELNKIEKTFHIKFLKVICVVSILIALLMPSEQTIYTMIAAKIITPNNIETTIQTGGDLADYIIDAVDKIVNNNDKDDEDDD